MIAARRLFSSAAAPQKSFNFGKALAFAAVPAGFATTAQTPLEPKKALDPKNFVPFKLAEVIPINHNTATFRFELPQDATELGLPVASCLVTRYKEGEKEGKDQFVIRPYTPIENEELAKKRVFDLVVKQYPAGKMSTHLHSMKPGEVLEMKGPIPKLPYTPSEHPHIGMIAGGTGITPMLQVVTNALTNKEDKTKFTLVFCNTTTEDILLKEQLDAYAQQHPDRFKVFYIVSKNAPKGMGSGHINADHIKQYMPKPNEGKVYVCGPPGMMAAVSGNKAPDYSQGEVGGLLKKLNYTEKDVFKF